MFAALSCAATMVIQIPIATGYLNFSDSLCLLAGWILGPWYGFAAGIVLAVLLEQAACREALEETGLHIRSLRYFGNQPWPFTDTQMVGFFAEADEAEPLRIQREELVDARWFTRETMPETPAGISIASAMIAAWHEGFKP